MVVGEREDAFAGVGDPGWEVAQAAGVPERHRAFGVQAVVADAVVAVCAGIGWDGFGGLAVSVAWSCAVKRAVGALLVVMLAVQVELCL